MALVLRFRRTSVNASPLWGLAHVLVFRDGSTLRIAGASRNRSSPSTDIFYIETMRDRGLDPEVRMKVADRLLDRALGKPALALDHFLTQTDPDPAPGDRMSDIGVAKRVASILARGRVAMALQEESARLSSPRCASKEVRLGQSILVP
jgi:hypothetical protein